jgi:two-component system response regulator HydG
MVDEEAFRRDLFHRINTFTIEIPPLRKRPGDIPLLLEYFGRLYKGPSPEVSFTSKAMDALMAYNWPGNVRELMNLVEQLSILHPGTSVALDMLPRCVRDHIPDLQITVDTHAREVALLRRTMEECGWNKSEASRRLGIPRTTLIRKLSRLGLKN